MCEIMSRDFEIHLKICENDNDVTTKVNMLPRYDVEEKTGKYFSHTYLLEFPMIRVNLTHFL